MRLIDFKVICKTVWLFIDLRSFNIKRFGSVLRIKVKDKNSGTLILYY